MVQKKKKKKDAKGVKSASFVAHARHSLVKESMCDQYNDDILHYHPLVEKQRGRERKKS